jgi:hypothetical protein
MRGFLLLYNAIMSWAARRQAKYLLGTISVLMVLIGLPLFFHFYEKPSCFDGKQNNMEEGIDCGGPCEKVCSFQAVDPIVHWKQRFQIVPGMYSVVALVENANDSYESESVPYIFRLYDSTNVFIAERRGRVHLTPHSVIPIFETGISTGERIPGRVEFSFEEAIPWVRSTFTRPDVTVLSRRLDEKQGTPRLFVTVRNNTLETFSSVPVVVVLYDVNGNAVHSSRTVAVRIPGTSDTELVFTWPQQFISPVARIDVFMLFD